jgi:hypothetical protein
MAQTTTALSGAAGTLSVRINNTGSFTDISGSSQSIDTVTMTRITGEAYTLEGTYAVLTFGKTEPSEVKVNILYTDTPAEGYQTLLAAWQSDHVVEVKWIPGGAVVGADTYTTSAGKITAADLPALDASSAGPIMCSFTVRVASITHAT